MKALTLAVAVSALAIGAAGVAAAQTDHAGYNHPGWGQDQGASHQWQRGERMGYNDWSTAQPVDYRQHHLSRPHRGYEWRESNGRYVMAAVATGVIASAIINGGR